MPRRALYLLIVGVALVAAVGLISCHFFGERGEVLPSAMPSFPEIASAASLQVLSAAWPEDLSALQFVTRVAAPKQLHRPIKIRFAAPPRDWFKRRTPCWSSLSGKSG
jgi:hypothetical protein